ncbi:MAG: PhnB protein [Acidobacteriota bacterium]|jgi:PhnB protein|nr:PhnB protein [Acidobacteriota bacterium]
MEAYLTFDGNAAEALAFYAQCLDGKVLFSMTWGESPMAADMPPEASNRIMHATLAARGHKLMAADAPPGYPFEGYKGFSLSVQSSDVKEGEQLFNSLAAGGIVTMPFAPTFWAAGFGMLVDKFGVSWMVNCEQPRSA